MQGSVKKVWLSLRHKVDAWAGVDPRDGNETTSAQQKTQKDVSPLLLQPQTLLQRLRLKKVASDQAGSTPGPEPSNALLWFQRNMKFVIAGGIALVLVLVGSGVGWNAATRAIVPDIQGQSVAEAFASLEAVGLVGRVNNDGCSGSTIALPDSVCLVAVVELSPGTKLRKGDVVTFSSQLAAAKVPDVTGMTYREAKAALAEALFLAERKPVLEPEVETVISARGKEVEGWIVAQQSPRSTESLVVGESVEVELELPEVTVPEVTGMTVSEAELILGPAGLLMADTYKSQSTIAGQAPQSGMSARLGSTLSFSFVVPDIVGFSVDEAKAALASVNLKLASQTPKSGATLIASQDRLSGDIAPAGSVIGVHYKVPDLVGLKVTDAEDAAKNAGLVFVVSQTTAPGDAIISEQSLPVGSGAALGSKVTVTAAVPIPTYTSGSSLSSVKSNLESAHFEVVFSPSSAPSSWRVVRLDPQPETLATYGSTVTIYLEDPTPPPSYSGGVQSGTSVYYKNCTEARNAGVTPIYRGQPGYASHLDRDNDGIACE